MRARGPSSGSAASCPCRYRLPPGRQQCVLTGEAPLTYLRADCSQTLALPRQLIHLASCPGPLAFLHGLGDCRVGACQNLHRARPLELALQAVGEARVRLERGGAVTSVTNAQFHILTLPGWSSTGQEVGLTCPLNLSLLRGRRGPAQAPRIACPCGHSLPRGR